MKSVLVPLFWMWCGLSVFALVRRRVKRETGSETSALSDRDTATAAALGVDVTPGSLPSDAVPAPAAQPVPTPAPPPTTLPPPSSDVQALSLGVPLSTVDSLAEALEGISIPCGLVPLTGTGEFDPKALVLVTDGQPAEVVGTAVADEIESLGFTLTSLDERRLMAQTDSSTVEIAVHPDVGVVDNAGQRRFPTAPPDAVVVELRLR